MFVLIKVFDFDFSILQAHQVLHPLPTTTHYPPPHHPSPSNALPKFVIELSGVQFGLKSYAWFRNRTNAQREFHLKSQVQLPLYYTRSILKSRIFFKSVFAETETRLHVRAMSTKQNDRCHFTKNPLERKNFIRANVQAVLKSCHCKNSLLQSLILVVWLNNISPSLLLRLWLRHRVFLGEKI